jgi:hypothetical protein
MRAEMSCPPRDGAALAIHLIATVEDFEILRRIDIVSVKVWLLRRWRLAQGFLTHLCLQVRTHIPEVKMKIAALCLCWVLIFTAPCMMAQRRTTPNQPSIVPNQSWDVLRQTLVTGNLRVERKDGKKFSGEIIRVTDRELEINRKGKLESFRRDEVKKVWLVVLPSNRTQFQTIGAVSGALAGIIIILGLASKECGGDCGAEKAGIAAAFIFLPSIGLFVGGALAGKGKRTLVYSAP